METLARFHSLYDVAAEGYRDACVQKVRGNKNHWLKRLRWLDHMLATEGKEA